MNYNIYLRVKVQDVDTWIDVASIGAIPDRVEEKVKKILSWTIKYGDDNGSAQELKNKVDNALKELSLVDNQYEVQDLIIVLHNIQNELQVFFRDNPKLMPVLRVYVE